MFMRDTLVGQFKDVVGQFCGGSGFPAAICYAGIIQDRGWKAAPTIYFKLVSS